VVSVDAQSATIARSAEALERLADLMTSYLHDLNEREDREAQDKRDEALARRVAEETAATVTRKRGTGSAAT
jgi:hypothetical protein